MVFDFLDHGIKQATLEMEGGCQGDGTEQGEDLLFVALLPADGADEYANGASGLDSQAGGGKARGGVVGEQQCRGLFEGQAQGLTLTGMEAEHLGDGFQLRWRGPGGSEPVQDDGGMDKRGRSMAGDLVPDGVRNHDLREIHEQVERADFVEVNQRAGIRDDDGVWRFNRCHGVPTEGL